MTGRRPAAFRAHDERATIDLILPPSTTAPPAARQAGASGDSSTDPASVRSRRALPVLLSVLVLVLVGLQITYPLTRSTLREDVTVAIVVAFAIVCVLHVAVSRGGRRAALVLAATAGPGYLIEVVGVHTGFPFGSYRYSDVFGPRLLDVPLVIGLAWTMLCWPAALVARRLVAGRVARVVLGAWATTAGDLFLDPQMVATGAWSWRDPVAHLPGVPDVPVSNYVGWLVVTLMLSALVQALMGDGDDTLGIGLYVWSWIAWTLALAVFLGRPVPALWGSVAMGTVAVPVAVRSLRRAGGAVEVTRRIADLCARRPRPGYDDHESADGVTHEQFARIRRSARVVAVDGALRREGTRSGSPPAAQLSWAVRIATHVAVVEGRLIGELDELRRSWDLGAADIAAPYGLNPAAQLREMFDRGGKRTRPVMTMLGWVAADVRDERRGHEDMVLAAEALEMLHCFALIHDDVMDESPTRRGRATMHESAKQLHTRRRGMGGGARFGESVAVLVGDLAHSEADRLAASLPLPMRRVWQQMVLELIAGQMWDVVGSAAADRRVDFARLVARQKTGNYTVARPLQLGAVAAGADHAALSALAEYGRQAGEAFALRDDMLGAYGDPRTTGKPAGEDIRSGKPTVLLALATESLRGRAATALGAAGSPRMTDAQVLVVQDAMMDQGVVAAVESMIEDRVGDAVAALDPRSLSADGVAQLTRVVDDLARRGR